MSAAHKVYRQLCQSSLKSLDTRSVLNICPDQSPLDTSDKATSALAREFQHGVHIVKVSMASALYKRTADRSTYQRFATQTAARSEMSWLISAHPG